MIPHTSSLPVVQPAIRRIVVEQRPTGVLGEYGMTVHFEGIPEGWARVHMILLDVLKTVGEEWVKADRRQRQDAAGRPAILVPGERV